MKPGEVEGLGAGPVASGAASAGRAPKAVLVISSSLPELLGICDRIAVMARGILGPARPVSEWTEHALMMEATRQTEAAATADADTAFSSAP